MKYFLVILFCVASVSLLAQNTYNHNIYWHNLMANDDDVLQHSIQGVIGVKNCYVRQAPSLNAEAVDSLQIGKKVSIFPFIITDEFGSKIEDEEKTITIKGIKANWVKVEYEHSNGEPGTGFLWKGCLAIGAESKEDVKFLTTIQKIDRKPTKDYIDEKLTLTVTVLNKNNEVLAEKSMQKDLQGSSYFTQNLIGNFELPNIENIYRIGFDGEACGVPSLRYYFAWNGSTLQEWMERRSVFDGGTYYYKEAILFPTEEGGKPNKIIKLYEEVEVTDEEKNNIETKTTWQEVYSWDGIQLKKTETSKKKISKRRFN